MLEKYSKEEISNYIEQINDNKDKYISMILYSLLLPVSILLIGKTIGISNINILIFGGLFTGTASLVYNIYGYYENKNKYKDMSNNLIHEIVDNNKDELIKYYEEFKKARNDYKELIPIYKKMYRNRIILFIVSILLFLLCIININIITTILAINISLFGALNFNELMDIVREKSRIKVDMKVINEFLSKYKKEYYDEKNKITNNITNNISKLEELLNINIPSNNMNNTKKLVKRKDDKRK